jgi:pimeloyl-ACP methyl ester carboxylesterase
MAVTTRRADWLPNLLVTLAKASGVGYLAASYTVSRWLTRPSPGKPRRTPADLGLAWGPLSCRTEDGLRLAGWAAAPARPRGTVVLFHGHRSNRAGTLERTALLVNAGYRCVAFDHRAHGESEGRKSSFGYHEARDVQAVLRLVRRQWPGEPCAAVGISMGAAALCFAGRADGGFDAVVLESVYRDIVSAFVHRIKTIYPPWFARLAPGIVRVTERRLRAQMHQIAPIAHVHRLSPAPVLMLTGTEDPHAPPDESRQVFERLTGPREFWLVPGAAHRDVLEVAGPAYRERVVGFLDRYLVA